MIHCQIGTTIVTCECLTNLPAKLFYPHIGVMILMRRVNQLLSSHGFSLGTLMIYFLLATGKVGIVVEIVKCH